MLHIFLPTAPACSTVLLTQSELSMFLILRFSICLWVLPLKNLTAQREEGNEIETHTRKNDGSIKAFQSLMQHTWCVFPLRVYVFWVSYCCLSNLIIFLFCVQKIGFVGKATECREEAVSCWEHIPYAVQYSVTYIYPFHKYLLNPFLVTQMKK